MTKNKFGFTIYLRYGSFQKSSDIEITSVEQQEDELGAVQNDVELYKNKWEAELKRNSELENKVRELENMYADLIETTNRAVQHYRKATGGE